MGVRRGPTYEGRCVRLQCATLQTRFFVEQFFYQHCSAANPLAAGTAPGECWHAVHSLPFLPFRLRKMAIQLRGKGISLDKVGFMSRSPCPC